MAFWSRRPKQAPTAEPTVAVADWASVTTAEHQQFFIDEGMLEPLLLLPATYGGTELPMNVVYVPRGLVALREQTVLSMVDRMISDGTANTYTTDVEYRGDSLVPSALHIHVTHSGGEGGGFHPTLTIW